MANWRSPRFQEAGGVVKKPRSVPLEVDRLEAARLGVKEAVERLELLTVVSSALSRAMDDYSSALNQVAEACAPDFADLCAIELVGETGEIRTIAYRVARGAALTAPVEWTPVGAGINPGRSPILSYDRPGEVPAARRVREALAADSLVVAPVTGGGLTLGWVVFATGTARRGLRPSALRVAEDIASRVAMTVQRVLLYRESVTAGHEQARAARRLRRLAAAAANLAGATTPEEVLRTACVEVCIVLDADAAAATWRQEATSPIEVAVGLAGAGAAASALESAIGGVATRGHGWISSTLPSSDPRHRAALAVFSSKQMSVDDELLLTSLASMVPVAFERALNTEKALLRQAELDAVLEASPVAILTLHPDGTVIGANNAAHQLFGWDLADDDPQFPPALQPLLRRLPADVAAGHPVTNRAVTTAGYDLTVSAAPLPGAGDSISGALVVANDVREQREAERALLQAQRLEAMGQVAGGIAHDFNNLLTVIVGYASILRRQLTDPAAADLLGHIETAVGRASSLTQQLLGFTRRPMDDLTVLDMVGAVSDLAPVLERLLSPSVVLDLQLPTGPVPVLADRSALEQTVLNLCLNSRDAIDGAGKVSIAVDDVELSEATGRQLGVAAGRYARLDVVDNGPGMSAEVRERCLEPFFTTKDRDHGTGLGLPTVYGYTAERGGTLVIDSSPGEGTRVTVWLPRATEGAEVPSGGGATVVPQLAGRALLVEDQGNLRSLAAMVLADAGMDVVDVPDAETALAALDGDGPWDVLVTDIVLPGMSGAELATRLRAVQPALPVLYVSGYADRDTRRKGLVDGARLLRKPYRPDELCHRVAEVMGAAGAGDPAQGWKR
jgi:two-component system cell cycle sensor histidine kinase/response regulator CckA